MKIIFTSAKATSASFIFYAASLKTINEQFKEASLDISIEPEKVDYKQYDAALFMGYDDKAKLAKAQNPKIITGVFDPRAGQRNKFEQVDFIAANGLESQDYFSQFCDNCTIYYTFPYVESKKECPFSKDKLTLGFHGGKPHLDAMFPRITNALEKLNQEIPLELWGMYNIKRDGDWKKARKLGFPVKLIQYDEDNYAKYMAHTDIGLVPQFKAIPENKILRYIVGMVRKGHINSQFDFIFHFKETTNIGRHLVFAQYGIPVISDMAPSSCCFIENEKDSFLAFHTNSWYLYLHKLAFNENLRKEMGNNLNNKYLNQASNQKQNERLIAFLKTLIK